MPESSRRQRREQDPGLQPERTALAWYRTLLGYGALLALALRHSWHRAGPLFWVSLLVLAVLVGVVYAWARQRQLMDIARQDLLGAQTVRGKCMIALGVLGLALLFAVVHIHQIWLHLGPPE